LVLAIISLVASIGFLILSIVLAAMISEDKVYAIFEVISWLLSIIALCMVMVGIQQEKPKLLRIQIYYQVLDTIVIIGLAIWMFVKASNGFELEGGFDLRIIGGIYIAILPIDAFFFYVFVSCYLYLKAKRNWSATIISTPVTMKMVNANMVQVA